METCPFVFIGFLNRLGKGLVMSDLTDLEIKLGVKGCDICLWLKELRSSFGATDAILLDGEPHALGGQHWEFGPRMKKMIDICPFCKNEGSVPLIYEDYREWLKSKDWYLLEVYDGEPFGTVYLKFDKGSKRVKAKGKNDTEAIRKVALLVLEQKQNKERY